MSNWLLKVSNTYFKAMNAYMHQQLLRMEYISADETVVQVLQEPGKAASSKSYMWAYASGRSERKKMVLYQYEPGVQQEKKLRTYLEDGRIECSNNVTERAIRPFTIGRKNWLFMNTVKGANSSAYIYSLVESAKQNGLKPYDYMYYLLKKLPDLDLGKETELESIMPWAELPNELYQKKS
jgi:hypothetical protein